MFNRSHNPRARWGYVWFARSLGRRAETGSVLSGTVCAMCHSPESQEQVGLGTGLVQALAKQVICFHSQSDVVTCFRSQSDATLHCCYLALVRAPRCGTACGGFCGSAVHLPELHMSVGQEDVSSDLSSISVPQVVSVRSPLPSSRE